MILEISLAYLLWVRVAFLSRERSQSKSLLLTETVMQQEDEQSLQFVWGIIQPT